MTDYVLPWDQPSDERGREQRRRRRHAPGLWAQRLAFGEPPDMPPGFAGAFTCCRNCPWEACERCPPNDAWLAFHAKTVDDDTPPRRTWWARLTGRTSAQENIA